MKRNKSKLPLSDVLTGLMYTIIFIGTICYLMACNKPAQPEHVCRWQLCPYKGITIEQYKDKAQEDEGSDGYYLDLLHIEHPAADYDQLEEMLFKPMTK